MYYFMIEDFVGNILLVCLQCLFGDIINMILVKLEGNNLAGLVKDRLVFSMIQQVESKGLIKFGDILIEVISGNIGIVLVMVAVIKGYKMVLIMLDNMSVEWRVFMVVFGVELVLVIKE